MLGPGQPAPKLEVPTEGGEPWKLSEQSPEAFALVVFYRGLHCPVCRRYLESLESAAEDFRARGVGFIAVSGDSRERAEQTQREWALARVPIGYGQSVESMRERGLFVPRAIKETEPELFGEPGLFLVRPDGTLYYAAVQSMPFARPPFREMLGAIDFVLRSGCPARTWFLCARDRGARPRGHPEAEDGYGSPNNRRGAAHGVDTHHQPEWHG